MKRSRLFTGSIVAVAMLVLTLVGGVASAAPAASTAGCAVAQRAPSHLSAPASQRYVAFKDVQVERMSGAGTAAQAGCVTTIQVASLTIVRPSRYALWKDRQAGN